MIVVTVQTEISKLVKGFVLESKKRMGTPIVHSGIHLGFKLQAFEENELLYTSFAYGLIGEFIFFYLGLFTAALMLLFGAKLFWLLIPAFFLTLPMLLRLLGYWLLYKGIRKAGYKGKIKLVKNENFIYEVVLNGSK